MRICIIWIVAYRLLLNALFLWKFARIGLVRRVANGLLFVRAISSKNYNLGVQSAVNLRIGFSVSGSSQSAVWQ